VARAITQKEKKKNLSDHGEEKLRENRFGAVKALEPKLSLLHL